MNNVTMSSPVDLRDLFSDTDAVPLECPNPETCKEIHNESGHHYGCECGACLYEYWMLKH